MPTLLQARAIIEKGRSAWGAPVGLWEYGSIEVRLSRKVILQSWSVLTWCLMFFDAPSPCQQFCAGEISDPEPRALLLLPKQSWAAEESDGRQSWHFLRVFIRWKMRHSSIPSIIILRLWKCPKCLMKPYETNAFHVFMMILGQQTLFRRLDRGYLWLFSELNSESHDLLVDQGELTARHDLRWNQVKSHGLQGSMQLVLLELKSWFHIFV